MKDCIKIIFAILILWYVIGELLSRYRSEDFYYTDTSNTPYSSGITSLLITDANKNYSTLSFPKGMILMFNGTVIPKGWVLCDGDNGTPDLRGRFPLGLNPDLNKEPSLSKNNIKDKKGSEKVSLKAENLPSHTHTYILGGDYGVCGSNPGAVVSDHPYSDTRKLETDPTGGSETEDSEPHENMPPFVVVNFIMKM
jgi:microcystin-dependent protein